MTNVTFLDGDGIQPIVFAAQRRQLGQLGPVRIGNCSPAARAYFQLTDVAGPPLDLPAWDHIAGNAGNKPRVVSLAEDNTATVPVPPTHHGGTGTT